METIVELKHQLRESGRRGLVLDIDDTLLWTAYSWVADMQVRFGNPEGLTTEELTYKYRLVQHVPYWACNPEAMDWILALRASEDAHRNPPLMENANHFVNKINQIKPILAYLTSRTESLLPVTDAWLRQHDFPKVPIIMKPSDRPSTDINEWKGEVLDYLYPEVEGIVDDNALLIDHIPKTYQGTLYLFGHQTVPKLGICLS